MNHRAAAIVLGVVAFAVNFFDNLYKLGSIEWVPNALSGALIAGAVLLWKPEWTNKRRDEERSGDRPTEGPPGAA